jgi:CDP-glucose 4,6-dehydratase
LRFFVTGHTGFKGAWLCVMLKSLGHEVYGYSLAPIAGGLFDEVGIGAKIDLDGRGNLKNKSQLKLAVEYAKPDVVVHLAAQPLVRESYESPHETFEVNTLGTINLLEAVRESAPYAYLLAITTDKVYKNTSKETGYVETDELGAADPYSSSKAMADIALQSWAYSFPQTPKLSIARAGNVIGPLDSSADRLIPDIIRSLENGQPIELRNPNATRPWQHVLDCLFGYLLLIEKRREPDFPLIWNFGPKPEDEQSVMRLVEEASKYLDLDWVVKESTTDKPEQQRLTLDSSQARERLGWTDLFSFGDSVRETLEFTKLVEQEKPELRWNLVSDYVEAYLAKSPKLKL